MSLAEHGHSFTSGWKVAYLYHLTRLRQLSAIDISLLWVTILLLQRWWWTKIVAAQMITVHMGSGLLQWLCKKLTKEVYAFSPYSNPYLWTRFGKWSMWLESSHCISKQASNLSQFITRLHELENSVRFQWLFTCMNTKENDVFQTISETLLTSCSL